MPPHFTAESALRGSARAARRDPDDCCAAIVRRSVHYEHDPRSHVPSLSNPTRRGILERLGHGPATIGELARPFGLALNGMKKHVGILEEVDLVVTAKVGRARKCQLGQWNEAPNSDPLSVCTRSTAKGSWP